MVAVLVPVAAALASCTDRSPNALDPKGSGAERIAGLTYLLLWISLAVLAIVMIGIAVAVVRGRKKSDDVDKAEVRWGEPFIVVSGVVIPALILGAVFVISVRDQAALSSAGDSSAMTIQVTGHLWWWEARYPNGAVTANEIHIPVDEPVRLELLTDDVIHSFWVPQLQAKMDMINGRSNYMWLDANEPGRYRGQCAEFCGLEHAQMIFYVVADPPDEFDDWLAKEVDDEPLLDPDEFEGREVFLSETCAGCHTVRGTEASGTVGPDLTHVAGRETIASGILPNTRADLSRWILHPQAIKPGTTMPPTSLDERELSALLDYLEALK
jgi:cytochrome c oxidase subunit 2